MRLLVEKKMRAAGLLAESGSALFFLLTDLVENYDFTERTERRLFAARLLADGDIPLQVLMNEIIDELVTHPRIKDDPTKPDDRTDQEPHAGGP